MSGMTDEEIEFESLFAKSRYGAQTRTDKRLKAERRAALTEKQHARGGRARSVQMNFRATPALRSLAGKLAEHLDASIADVIEDAVQALAKKHGVAADA